MGVGVQGLGSIGSRGDGCAVERSIGRRCRRDCDRRSHGPRRRRRGTPAGRGDVSRHRHLWRKHCDSDPAPARRGTLAWGPAKIRRCRRDYRAAGVWPRHRTSAVRRPRDRRGRPVSRRSTARTAWSVDQPPWSRRNPGPVAIAHGCIRPWLSAVVWRDARHFDRSPETPRGLRTSKEAHGRAAGRTHMARRERAGGGGCDDRR